MPTLECLDERTKLVKETLDRLSETLTVQYKDIRLCIDERDRRMDAQLEKIEKDIQDLKESRAEDRGKRSILIVLGGIALTAISAIFGAVGNILYQWLTGPHGPIRLD